MRLLDTREKKSPRFIVDEFDPIPGTLPAGDMLLGAYYPDGFVGCGIEFKLSLSDQQNGDYGIHTEPIERFHDECANKIKPFMIKNPGCDFHAIWWVERKVSNHEKEMWDHYCYQYYVWGHIVHSKVKFIECIKNVESGFYVRDQVYIKRSHEEPTDLARALRVPKGISSELAIDVSSCQTYIEFKNRVGLRKKDKKLTKNGMKLICFLRKLVRFYNQIDCSKMRSEEQIGPGEEP